MAGIRVPEIFVRNVAGRDILFIKRFNRIGLYERKAHMSALSLLEISENDFASFSYIKLAEKIKQYGDPMDLKVLFCRLAFNIRVRNTDDHPRNIGEFSPMYRQNLCNYLK